MKATKIFGDYALLVGDYADALEKFAQAIEQAKLLNDDLYVAGCQEAYAAGLYLQSNMKPPMDDATLQQITERMEEAISHYAKVKNSKELHVEALLRFGHFNARCGRVTKRIVAMECASKAVQEAAQLTTQDRVSVLIMTYLNVFRFLYPVQQLRFVMKWAACANLDSFCAIHRYYITSYAIKEYQFV